MSGLQDPMNEFSNVESRDERDLKHGEVNRVEYSVNQGPETIRELNKLLHKSKLDKLGDLLKRCFAWR